jgi:uncharacterized NAD(P)/FAD-binding protein YdhS
VRTPPSLAIVGAGPRGSCVLERLAANAPELLTGPLTIHVIDPHPPGGGRVWRTDQSPLLRLNSTAADVTLFLDETVRCEGPIVPGPTLAEWSGLDANEFPTRHEGNAYFSWFYERAVAALPDDVEVVTHARRVVDVVDVDDGQRLVLDDGSTLDVDVVLLTLGHLDADPSGEHERIAAFAAEHGLTYLPPAYGADVDLSAFEAGEDVLVRGMGLAFVDIQVLVTEGRGGRFLDAPGGGLTYVPSGREPILHVGSRRGVPYRAKPTYELRGPAIRRTRYFTKDAVEDLLASRERVEFRRDVWPLIAKDIEWAAYHELFHAHPDRVTMTWDEFDAAFEHDPSVVERAVPDAADRIDWERLDRPLKGLTFADDDELQSHIRDHIRADIARRADPHFSADVGAFNQFLVVFGVLPYVLGSPKLSARSIVEEFDDWWFGFFSYYASGPPPRRLEELLALSEAGVVHFLPPDMRVELDDVNGRFVTGDLSTTAMIDAVLPKPTVVATRDPLVASLAARGELTEQVLREGEAPVPTGRIRVDRSGRVIDRDGNRHPQRFSLGIHTTARAPAFARPHTSSPALRANDACARAMLCVIEERKQP